ncbi:MAG: hypothetical protein GY928_20720 [Colwellia sp.]|nr:hypothetical protein [Colwellia sp.]
MIECNVEIKQINLNVFDIRIISSELQELFKKHNGIVHIKISKPMSKGTNKQNKTMHLLLREYYETGMHSAPEGYTLSDFKLFMKLEYGPVSYIYHKGKTVEVLKSWSDYNKQERSDFISGLLSEIHQSGAYNESEKIREIIDGMELNQK